MDGSGVTGYSQTQSVDTGESNAKFILPTFTPSVSLCAIVSIEPDLSSLTYEAADHTMVPVWKDNNAEYTFNVNVKANGLD